MAMGSRSAGLALAASALLSVLACSKGASPTASSSASGAPKPTPTGVPIGAPTSSSIGPAGGGLASSDGQITVKVPAGAVSGAVGFSIQEITNFAPGAVGNAYRLGPEGSRFSQPVELVFLVDLATDLDAVTVSYQDAQSGFWLHAPSIARDEAAHTLTVATSHFSDWSLVTQPTAEDLTGTFTLTQTVDIPFTATGAGTFNFAGSNSYENFYLFPGTVTVPTPMSYGALSCTPNAVGGDAPDGGPTFTLDPQSLVELVFSSPSGTVLYFGINAQWSLSCTDASGNPSTALMSTQFDTYGINLLGCNRSYVGTPVAGPDYCQGTYTIDCGTDGVSTATWQFQSASCGQACTPSPTGNICDAWALDCASGASTCADTGTPNPSANGTSCGTNEVCNGGACVSCTAGLSCTPANICDLGATSCSTGTSVCADTGNPNAAANGTSCGANEVCNGGACVSCTAGLSCTPANPCDLGTTSCSTGTSVCVDTGNAAANGTSCGTNEVCSAGACVSCTAGLTCTPATNTNPCDAWATSCASGTSVCADTGVPVPVVTPCGTSMVCNAGSCVASETVTGTRDVTYWPDSGPLAPVAAPDVTVATVAVALPAGTAAWVTYPGTFSPTGTFSIPDVPAATSYLLVFVDGTGFHRVVQTSASTLDLGYDLLGRADVALPTASTPVAIDVTGGLTPWDPGGDEVELVSSNADVLDFPIAGAALASASTSGSVVEDWYASAIGGPLYLLEAADPVTLVDLSTASFTVGASTYPYRAATAAGSVTDVATPAAIVTPVSAAGTTIGSVAVEWDLGNFESLLPVMGPAATVGAAPHTLQVGAYAQGLGYPAPVPRVLEAPVLLRLQVAAGGPGSSLVAPAPLGYAHALGSPFWSEWRSVEFDGEVSYLAPGATAPLVATAPVGRIEPMATAATPIDPTLTPVQTPLVNGLGAFFPLTGVGTSPTFSWTAPATGAPTSYTVEIFWLGAQAGATVSTRVAMLTTAGTEIEVPPGVLATGNTYYARITAVEPIPPGTDDFAAAPLRFNNVYAYASVLTGTLSP